MNPKSFYLTIQPYILEVSYEEFLNSLDDIVWINQNNEGDIVQRMNKAHLPTDGLI